MGGKPCCFSSTHYTCLQLINIIEAFDNPDPIWFPRIDKCIRFVFQLFNWPAINRKEKQSELSIVIII